MAFTIYNIQESDIFTNKEILLDDIQNATAMVAKRRSRFVEGYDVKKELIILYNKYFDSRPHLEEKGLDYFYNKMKNEIVQNNFLISLVLCGLNMHDVLINNYMTIDKKWIQLTISSISRNIVRFYFTKNELESICRSCPNFNIYYKTV